MASSAMVPVKPLPFHHWSIVLWYPFNLCLSTTEYMDVDDDGPLNTHHIIPPLPFLKMEPNIVVI